MRFFNKEFLPQAVGKKAHQVVHKVVVRGHGRKDLVNEVFFFVLEDLPEAEMGLLFLSHQCYLSSFLPKVVSSLSPMRAENKNPSALMYGTPMTFGMSFGIAARSEEP